MVLRRLGNKKKIAQKIIEHFPPHDIYIEPFFGAGGLFFNKPIVKYNFLNDLDNDVVNLYDVITKQYEEFKYLLEITPYHNGIWDRFKKERYEDNPLMKALRFLYLSNYGYLGKKYNLQFGIEKNKHQSLILLNDTYRFLKDTSLIFNNTTAVKHLKEISFRKDITRTFCYCDPPYVRATNNYKNNFTEQDLRDLIVQLKSMKIKFAISEFDTDLNYQLCKEYGLNKNYITNRKTLHSRNTEILMTNYEMNIKLFE